MGIGIAIGAMVAGTFVWFWPPSPPSPPPLPPMPPMPDSSPTPTVQPVIPFMTPNPAGSSRLTLRRCLAVALWVVAVLVAAFAS